MTRTTLKGGATSARRQLMDLAFQALALLVLCIALVSLGALNRRHLVGWRQPAVVGFSDRLSIAARTRTRASGTR